MRAVLRYLLGAIVLVAIVAAGMAWYLRGPGPMAFASGSSVQLADFKGPNPTGVPASLAKEDIVKRGEYLAHAADCMVCHSTRGGKEYAGGLAFKLPFGELYSTNITPDKETGIGNYSDRDFLNAVQHGTRRDGAPLYPAMPYTSYSYLTDDDALAIKAYLFSLAPVRSAPPQNTLAFPFNQRWAMVFWSTLFNRGVRFEPNGQQSAEWNRGRLPCRGAGALRRMPHAAKPGFRAGQPQEICRRHYRRVARFQHHFRQGHRAGRLARRRSGVLSVDRPRRRPRHRVGTDGRSGR